MSIYSRYDWKALAPVDEIQDLETPLESIVLAHTVTASCLDSNECIKSVREIQEHHMQDLGFSDIGFNFLVGGDGNVYTGRGWDKVGAHSEGFNDKSIGIALIGTFDDQLPNQLQLNATKSLLDQAVELGKLAPEFKLYGHSQLIDTIGELADGDEF